MCWCAVKLYFFACSLHVLFSLVCSLCYIPLVGSKHSGCLDKQTTDNRNASPQHDSKNYALVSKICEKEDKTVACSDGELQRGSNIMGIRTITILLLFITFRNFSQLCISYTIINI